MENFINIQRAPIESEGGADSIGLLIQDAGNQFAMLHFAQDLTGVKEILKSHPLKTLEEYIGKTTVEIEKYKPGICAAYNAVISGLLDPDLTEEKLGKLLDDGFAITFS